MATVEAGSRRSLRAHRRSLPIRICVCVASGLSTRSIAARAVTGGGAGMAARHARRDAAAPGAEPASRSRATASVATTSPTSTSIVLFGRYQLLVEIADVAAPEAPAHAARPPSAGMRRTDASRRGGRRSTCRRPRSCSRAPATMPASCSSRARRTSSRANAGSSTTWRRRSRPALEVLRQELAVVMVVPSVPGAASIAPAERFDRRAPAASADRRFVPRVSAPAVSAASPSLPGGSCADAGADDAENSTSGSSWYSATTTRSPLSKVARVSGGSCSSSAARATPASATRESEHEAPSTASSLGLPSAPGGTSSTTVRLRRDQVLGRDALHVRGGHRLPLRLEAEELPVVAEHDLEVAELVRLAADGLHAAQEVRLELVLRLLQLVGGHGLASRAWRRPHRCRASRSAAVFLGRACA